MAYSSHVWRKNEKQLESIKLASSKVDDSQQHHGFNSGPRNYFIPKIYMRKFDGKDPIMWIFQMEQFFDLHQVPTMQKVTIVSLYLEPNQFVWQQCLCDRKKDSIISCSIFTKELIAHYGDTNRNTLLEDLFGESTSQIAD